MPSSLQQWRKREIEIGQPGGCAFLFFGILFTVIASVGWVCRPRRGTASPSVDWVAGVFENSKVQAHARDGDNHGRDHQFGREEPLMADSETKLLTLPIISVQGRRIAARYLCSFSRLRPPYRA
jgi:hypothetical protein